MTLPILPSHNNTQGVLLPQIDQHLLLAYQRTHYRVDAPPCTVRIGQPCPVLEQWLRQHSYRHWHYLSAHNPASRLCSPAENARRHAALLAEVIAAGWPYTTGRGYSPADDWPAEESLVLFDLPAATALACARRWGQWALVTASLYEPARLLWVETDPNFLHPAT